MDNDPRHLLNAATVRRFLDKNEILVADLRATVASIDAAVLKRDQAAVEELRVKLHNVIDELVDHKWSGAKLIDLAKKDFGE